MRVQPGAARSGDEELGVSHRRPGLSFATRFDFWLDAAMLATFTLAYSFTFTGVVAHEWLAFALASALVVHLTLHWRWVLTTTRRLVSTTSARARIQWLANAVLLVSLTFCLTSGFLISEVALPDLGLHVAGSQFWSALHTTTASISLILVAVHVALDWKWIVTVCRRLTGRHPTVTET